MRLTFKQSGLIALLFVVCSILAACNTLSKDECVAADWFVIGEADGTNGYDVTKRFGRHVDSCAKASIVPDQTLWSQGYQKGLRTYCTPASGVAVGEAGKQYANVCPLDKAPRFLKAYEIGKRVYDLRRNLESKKNSISFYQRQVSDKLSLITTLPTEDQSRVQVEIADLNAKIAVDQAELARLSGDLALAERDLREFKLSL